MKKLLLLCVFISPLAMADDSSAPANTGKPEETVTLSEQATTPLLERVRGTIIRAVKDGKIVATATTPAKKTN